MIALALPFVAMLGVAAVCRAIGLSPSTWYRLRTPAVAGRSRPLEAPARRSPRRLSEAEERGVLDALHEPRFAEVRQMSAGICDSVRDVTKQVFERAGETFQSRIQSLVRGAQARRRRQSHRVDQAAGVRTDAVAAARKARSKLHSIRGSIERERARLDHLRSAPGASRLSVQPRLSCSREASSQTPRGERAPSSCGNVHRGGQQDDR